MINAIELIVVVCFVIMIVLWASVLIINKVIFYIVDKATKSKSKTVHRILSKII